MLVASDQSTSCSSRFHWLQPRRGLCTSPSRTPGVPSPVEYTFSSGARKSTMEPHSRPCSSQNGTLRFPQALVLLLTTCLAGPTSDRVTQTDTGPALVDIIRNSAHHLFCLFNPFVVNDNLQSSLFVGMVKLTAVCGLGSAFWLWSKRDKKGRPASSAGRQSARLVGKNPR